MDKFQIIDQILTKINALTVSGYQNVNGVKSAMDGLVALSQKLSDEDAKTAERIKALEDKVAALEPKDKKVVELKKEENKQ